MEALYQKKDEKAAAAMESAKLQGQWDTSGLSDDWGGEDASIRAYNCPSCGARLLRMKMANVAAQKGAEQYQTADGLGYDSRISNTIKARFGEFRTGFSHNLRERHTLSLEMLKFRAAHC